MDAAAAHIQVTSVERGYNIYQANCAQCHGVDGEGGVGPTLNRQDKLFAHLNPDYLANILEVGGRYACGDPNSIMPLWSNTGQPPGPLNYKQVEDLIAFIRAEKGEEYRVMDPSLWEPVKDETTGEEKTFEGWVDPNYLPEPGATPYPACWTDEFTGGEQRNPGPVRRRRDARPVRRGAERRGRRDLGDQHPVRAGRGQRPGRRAVHDPVQQPRGGAAQRRDQGRDRRVAVQGRDRHRPHDGRVLGAGARRRAPTSSSARCIRTWPATSRWGADRWRRPHFPHRARRRRAAGSSAASSTPTAGPGPASRPRSGSS